MIMNTPGLARILEEFGINDDQVRADVIDVDDGEEVEQDTSKSTSGSKNAFEG